MITTTMTYSSTTTVRSFRIYVEPVQEIRLSVGLKDRKFYDRNFPAVVLNPRLDLSFDRIYIAPR